MAHAAFGAGPTSRTKRRNPSRPQVHPYPGRVRCARSFKRGGGIRANNGYATGRSHQSRLCLVVGFFAEHVLQWWRAADVGYEGWGADVVLVLQRFWQNAAQLWKETDVFWSEFSISRDRNGDFSQNKFEFLTTNLTAQSLRSIAKGCSTENYLLELVWSFPRWRRRVPNLKSEYSRSYWSTLPYVTSIICLFFSIRCSLSTLF